MIDCGFSCKETERRLERLGYSPADLSAVLVTHEHGDHVRGIPVLARKYDLPVWLTRGTFRALRDVNVPRVDHFDGHTEFVIDELQVRPFTVPHDATEPCQFVFEHAGQRLGVLTDTGRMTLPN